MAKGKKTGGRNFEKGKSGNPKGTSLAHAIHKAKREEIEYARDLLRMTRSDAAAINEGEELSNWVSCVYALIRKNQDPELANNGDINFLAKVLGIQLDKIQVDHTSSDDSLKNMTKEQLSKVATIFLKS